MAALVVLVVGWGLVDIVGGILLALWGALLLVCSLFIGGKGRS